MPVVALKDAGVYFDKDGPLAKQLRAAATKGLYSAALRMRQDIVARVIPNLKPFAPVDRAVYKAGWQVQRTPTGAVVYNPVPYAAIIENGVPASNTVLSTKVQMALAEWVRRRLGIGKGSGGKPNKIAAINKLAARFAAQKENFAQKKAKFSVAREKALAAGKPLPKVPTPPKPPRQLTSNGIERDGFGRAWEVAGAIMHAFRKRGIFARGKGLRVLETYVKQSLPAVIRQEVEKEMAKV